MIKGKSKVEFGTGDILITPLVKEDLTKGCLVLQNKGNRVIGEYSPTKDFEKSESDTLKEAADTIEALSAKLADMERSAEDCGGGWIYCGDGKNLPEIERDVLLSTRSLDVYKGYRANTEGYFYAEGEGYILYENVLAWMPQPEPYHEP